MSRGTGFVCFWRLEDATRCLQEAEEAAEAAPTLKSMVNVDLMGGGLAIREGGRVPMLSASPFYLFMGLMCILAS